MALLTLLVLLALPALARSGTASHRGVCADNLRRLGVALQAYADDHDGRYPRNSDGPGSLQPRWANGWLSYDPASEQNYELDYIRSGTLYPYAGQVGIYRCPSDPSYVVVRLAALVRNRSYSLNSWLGEAARGWSPSIGTLMPRSSDVRRPGQTFTFIDEHPDSINDPALLVDLLNRDRHMRIVDYPGSHHEGGANLMFVDGHLEYWRWQDPRTTLPVRFWALALNVASPNNRDIARLQDVTTHQQPSP